MWVTITEEDFLSRLSDIEKSPYNTIGVSDSQPDPLGEIIRGVIREVRSKVAHCPNNRLGPDGTIPDELLHHALAIIRYRFLSRLPVSAQLTEARKQEYSDGMAALSAAARCEYVLEQPDTETKENLSQNGGSPSICARPPRFNNKF